MITTAIVGSGRVAPAVTYLGGDDGEHFPLRVKGGLVLHSLRQQHRLCLPTILSGQATIDEGRAGLAPRKAGSAGNCAVGCDMAELPVSTTAAPIIVSALFCRDDFAWLNGLRRAHFPPDRNQLPAHLTLFHHLPPSIEAELKRRLSEATRRARPPATASGLINLGRGVAIRIEAPELESLRAELADAFAGLLVPQDAAGWRPHVTIQNKVQPAEAKTLLTSLARDFQPRRIVLTGLAAWWYRGGPWEPISRHMFR